MDPADIERRIRDEFPGSADVYQPDPEGAPGLWAVGIVVHGYIHLVSPETAALDMVTYEASRLRRDMAQHLD